MNSFEIKGLTICENGMLVRDHQGKSATRTLGTALHQLLAGLISASITFSVFHFLSCHLEALGPQGMISC